MSKTTKLIYVGSRETLLSKGFAQFKEVKGLYYKTIPFPFGVMYLYIDIITKEVGALRKQHIEDLIKEELVVEGKVRKLKNVSYRKVKDDSIDGEPHQRHYFEVWNNEDGEYITSVLLWDSVLMLNKYGYHNE